MVLPPLTFTEEQAIAIADPEATITQYVKQMFARFVRGEGRHRRRMGSVPGHARGHGAGCLPPGLQEAYDAKYGG